MSESILRQHCLEVWGKGDLALARKMYASDIIDLNPSPGQRKGPEGLIDIVRLFHDAMTDVSIDLHEIADLGDNRWLDRWTMRGRHTGPIMGFAPTGRMLEFSGCDVVTFRDGKIISQWHVEETLQLLLQMGLTLPEPVLATLEGVSK